MKPTQEQIDKLKGLKGDPEAYHSKFDNMLEERLMGLDPEWMKAMERIYEESGASRWCA